MKRRELFPRFVERRLLEALDDTPVVLIHGPRQCGKTTFAKQVGDSRGHSYFSFDDDTMLAAAKSDPVGFVLDLPERVVLDEVQRAPEIFGALKLAIDRDRIPGRFLLTGSSNVLLVPKLADSLAGRMEVVRLFPLSQSEISGVEPNFLQKLFDNAFGIANSERLGDELIERVVAGGYPEALARSEPRRRSAWYREYVDLIVQRDVRELARIRSLDVLPRLIELAGANTANLLNVSSLAAPFQVSRPTIRDYVTLLERVFLIELLAPWHSNRVSRLTKSPKLHIGDTGLACSLLSFDSAGLAADRSMFGHLLESFVYQELRRHASWFGSDVRFHHFRQKDGAEVDVVLETEGRRLAGVEVKASATLTNKDFRGLRALRDAAGDRFAAGVVLYDGEAGVRMDDRLYGWPIRRLWEIA